MRRLRVSFINARPISRMKFCSAENSLASITTNPVNRPRSMSSDSRKSRRPDFPAESVDIIAHVGQYLVTKSGFTRLRKNMATRYVTCPNCHTQNPGVNARCLNCGTAMPVAPSPMQQVPQQQGAQIPGADKKIAAGLCGILLGGLGIHKFILGYQQDGIILLSVS